MIAWAIAYALESAMFDRIIVSTDDESVAQAALAAGAEIPFMRPANLADDFTPTVPVIAHAVESCQSLGWDLEYVCCIYPCVPFLQISDLVAAFDLMVQTNASYAYLVTEYVHPIQRSMRRLITGKMEFFQSEHELTRTQDLERSYHDTGQFYWGKASSWNLRLKMHTAGVGLIVPNWRVIDIDNVEDWARAELLYDLLAVSPRS